MTKQDTDELIDRHLSGWLDAPDGTPTLRERIAAMIAEAESARDKLWRDGAETMKHELNSARYGTRHAMQTLDDLHIQIDEYGVTGQTDGSIQSKINAVCQERDALKTSLASMTIARDSAIAAAHLAVEEGAALLEQVQQQIDAVKPGLGRDQCKDDYEHGHRNGAFFVLVEIRRALKERAEEAREVKP